MPARIVYVGPYRGRVEATLSHAELVADPLHVMKQLNEAITNLRRNLQAHTRLRSDGSWHLLSGKSDDLLRGLAKLFMGAQQRWQSIELLR